MDSISIDGVVITVLKTIIHPKGNVLHAIKKSDPGFAGFGEAYFSTVNHGEIKGWKKHLRMTLNLVVPVGDIRFVMYDDRETSVSKGNYAEIILSPHNYLRLTVPPGIWVAFQGIGNDLNLLLNLANLEHDPAESENRALESIAYAWEG
jgi:dTDP-4-dehydrorhamnose 3,5-epimerase